MCKNNHLCIAYDCGYAKRPKAAKVRMTLGINSVANVTVNILCYVTRWLSTQTCSHTSLCSVTDPWFATWDCNIGYITKSHIKTALAGSKWTKHKRDFLSHQETQNLGETHRLFSTLRDRGRYAYGSGLPFFFTSPLAFLAWYSVPGVSKLPWHFFEACFIGRWMPEPPAEITRLMN